MDKKRLEELERAGELRKRLPDKARINSMLEAAGRNAGFVCTLGIDEKSATVVFRELYESFRQLGDARLWGIGFEPIKHTASIEALKDGLGYVDYMKLDRLRVLRNNANYRGYMATKENAEEIRELWMRWSERIIGGIGGQEEAGS